MMDSSELARIKLKSLMPRNYSDLIRDEANNLRPFYKNLPKPNLFARAAYNVLDKRHRRLWDEEHDLGEVRLERSAQIEWAEKQMDRVTRNKHFPIPKGLFGASDNNTTDT